MISYSNGNSFNDDQWTRNTEPWPFRLMRAVQDRRDM